MRIQEVTYVIVFSALFFYVIVYYFLKKIRAFGNLSYLYYSIASLLISVVLGISMYLLRLFDFLAVLLGYFFIGVFLFLYVRYTFSKVQKVYQVKNTSYNRDKMIDEIKDLIRKYELSRENERNKISKEIKKKLEELVEIFRKEGRNVEKEDWYVKARKIID